MLENLPWRSVVVLIAALVIASGGMAWGIVLVTDRGDWDKAAATQKIHAFKIQRTARID